MRSCLCMKQMTRHAVRSISPITSLVVNDVYRESSHTTGQISSSDKSCNIESKALMVWHETVSDATWNYYFSSGKFSKLYNTSESISALYHNLLSRTRSTLAKIELEVATTILGTFIISRSDDTYIRENLYFYIFMQRYQSLKLQDLLLNHSANCRY